MGFSPISSLSFILFLFHFHSTISSSHFCALDQSLSLLQFKESFSINSSASARCQHPKTESWKEGTDCCSWDGVTCDLKTGHVTGLDLACSMLYGTLHSNSTLFSLHHLQKLDLSDNHFNFSNISSRFGQFSNLTLLNLNFSVFAGQVPSEITHLSKLVSLDLSRNDDLSLEPISFDKLVRNLTKLRELDLSSVDMSLVVPDSLTNLSSSFSTLYLRSCGLQGKFPGNIFLFPNLKSLDLSYNEGLTGSFPSSNLSNVLSLLGLSNTRISVYLENDLISNLKSLKYMYLRNCNIIRSDLALLGNLTHVTFLDLSSNNFSGQIPISLGNLTHLTSLYLSNNNFSGQITSSLGNLTHLTSLYLSINNLNGQIPSSFGNLVQLYALNLGSNKFMGQVPDSLGSLVNLLDLDLSNNQLVGPIHSQLNTLSNLESLILYGNLFNGTIPSFLFALPSLQYLDLHNNNLIGNISELHHNSLTYLDLSNNNFTGEIPKVIAKLKALQLLNLSHNSLTGHIQSSLGNLTNLKSLDLSSNLLTGRIPTQLGGLTFLAILNLSHNQLEGRIPSGEQFNTFDATSFEGNLGLCGFQVLKVCYGVEEPSLLPSSFDEGDGSTLFEDAFGWKAVTMGYGCGFVFGVATGYIMFRTKKPSWFFRMIEDIRNYKSKKTKKNAGRFGDRRN